MTKAAAQVNRFMSLRLAMPQAGAASAVGSALSIVSLLSSTGERPLWGAILACATWASAIDIDRSTLLDVITSRLVEQG